MDSTTDYAALGVVTTTGTPWAQDSALPPTIEITCTDTIAAESTVSNPSASSAGSSHGHERRTSSPPTR